MVFWGISWYFEVLGLFIYFCIFQYFLALPDDSPTTPRRLPDDSPTKNTKKYKNK